jgi:hypothetical protein
MKLGANWVRFAPNLHPKNRFHDCRHNETFLEWTAPTREGKQRHDCGLRAVLRGRNGLGVDIERLSQGRVAEKFLHYLELGADTS